VAIAAALVPPIATVGIGLALGQTEIALGAALLFGTNIVAIVLGAGLNFMLAGISGIHKAGAWGRRSLITLILICLGLAVPLTSVLLSRLSRSVRLESAIESKLPGGVKLVSVSRLRGGGFEVEVESEKAVKEGLASEIAETIEEIEGGKESVKLRTELIQRSQSGE
jgi:uncharacterized membrane protein